MFQFPGFASCYGRIAGLQPAGLPHSEIPGSKVACTYPGLFAACHVFHRLLEPRHPPYALTYFRLHYTSYTSPKKEREKNMHIPWLSFLVYFLHKEANKIALVSIRLTQVFYFFIFLTHITYIYIIYTSHGKKNAFLLFQYVNERLFSGGELLMIGFAYPLFSQPRVENNGFEPLTPCVQSRCSSQLS